MQKNALAEVVADEVRLKPARLEVAMPWELPQGHKNIIAEAIAGEAWLQRLGLEGLLTAVSNSDMSVFRSAVERLAGMLRYARQEGAREALAGRRDVMRVAQLFGLGGFAAGVIVAALVGLF